VPERPRAEKIATVLCIGIVVSLLFRESWWLVCGAFNVDEFENLQVIWLWEKGVLPFRDYRHSHMPVHNLLLYPVYKAFGPTDGLLGWVRIIFAPWVLFSPFMVAYLGHLVGRRPLAAVLSVILFLSCPTIAGRVVEIRPDVLANPLTLGSVILFLQYLRHPRRRHHLLWISAILMGLALLFSLKGILIFLVMILFIEHFHFHALGMSFAARIRKLLLFVSLLCLPYFSLFLLFLAGDLIQPVDVRILLTSGMSVLHTPWTQEYKRNLCNSLLSANAIPLALGLLATYRSWVSRGSVSTSGASFLSAAVGISILQAAAQPLLFPHFLVLPFAFLSVLAASELARHGPSTLAILAIAAVLAAQIQAPQDLSVSRNAQLETFRYVLSVTDETTPVLDGVSGLGCFRPILGSHIYYRPSHFREDFLSEQEDEVAAALLTGTVGAVIDDPTIRASPRRIRELIDANYAPSRNPFVWLPKNHL